MQIKYSTELNSYFNPSRPCAHDRGQLFLSLQHLVTSSFQSHSVLPTPWNFIYLTAGTSPCNLQTCEIADILWKICILVFFNMGIHTNWCWRIQSFLEIHGLMFSVTMCQNCCEIVLKLAMIWQFTWVAFLHANANVLTTWDSKLHNNVVLVELKGFLLGFWLEFIFFKV